MWPWDVSNLTPEERAVLRQQALTSRRILRPAYFRIAIVVCIFVLVMLLIILHGAHDPVQRTLMVGLMIAGGAVMFFRNPRNDRFDPRPFSLEDEILRGGCKPEQNIVGGSATREAVHGVADIATGIPGVDPGLIPPQSSTAGTAGEGAPRQIHDLSELPPELATNPEVQKLFELGGVRGVWMKKREFPSRQNHRPHENHDSRRDDNARSSTVCGERRAGQASTRARRKP